MRPDTLDPSEIAVGTRRQGRPASAGAGHVPLLELAVLGLVSMATVTALTLSFAAPAAMELAALPLDRLSGAALTTALLMLLGGAAMHLVRTARREMSGLAAETARLQRRLASAESIVHAEPQVLIYWEPGQPLAVMTHGLTTVAGVPEGHRDLLRFGQWLEDGSAHDLKLGLDALFEAGRAFNAILRTRAGGHIEAEGRSAGGRAVLRFRDVVGYKRDLAKLIDRHEVLAADIQASRALIDSLPSPVWFRGPDGRLSWVNRAYCAAVGAAGPDEVAARAIELLDMRQRQAVERTVLREEPYRERVDVLLDGERKAHDLVVLPVGDGQVGAALDVTAVEQAQGELDRRSAAFERTLDKVSTAVAIFTPDRRLSYFNEAYLRLVGLEAAWLKSGPSETAVLDRLRETGRLPETTNYRDWRMRFLTRMRSSPSAEDTWHLPDGRTLRVLAETRDDGGVTYLYTDETEALALERLFHQQLRTQRETLDSLNEGVAVFGTDGRLKFSNRAFAAIWHLPETMLDTKPHIGEVIARAAPLFGDLDVWGALRSAVTGFAERREPFAGTMTRNDRSIVAYSTTPLPDGGTLMTFTDVTDEKRSERLLLERNEALIVADRLKNRFIGHVSYELRTPLTTIIGFSDMLSSPLIGTLNPKQREYLADIGASSKALLALVDNILDLATIDAGAIELKLGPVTAARVIDDAIEGVVDRANQARLTIDIGLAENATTFVADEARVRQVLYNLISNAVGFSKRGDTVMISAWREGEHMKFAVEDRGVGMSEEQLSRIFERFESQARGSTHRGAGLGLSIVKSLVELHGGTVDVASELAKGTRVVVAFPVGVPVEDSGTVGGAAVAGGTGGKVATLDAAREARRSAAEPIPPSPIDAVT